jgi:RNA polymerase sigma-70 factor, ECF subfamily
MDRNLIERAQGGDRESFGALAARHGDRLFGIARRILRDLDLAEDAVQDALVIAWRELPRLRDPDRFEPWLIRIVVRACYAASRSRRKGAIVRVLIEAQAETRAPDPMITIAERDELERAFRRLSPDQRAILVLHHYVGLEPAEIADVLGIPAGTARSRLHYGHRALRAVLEADARLVAAGGRPA